MSLPKIAAVSALLCACGSSSSKITIGAVLSLSGSCASGSDEIVKGIQLAIAEINKAGGVNGKQLALTVQDDQSTADGATAAATHLADVDKVSVVIGAMCSGETEAAAAVLSAKGIVQISPISTSPAITNFSDNGFLFRTCPSDNFQAKLLSKLMNQQSFANIAIAYIDDDDNGSYGEGLRDAIATAFTASGGHVLAEVALPPSATPAPDYKPAVDALLANGRPDAIAWIGFPADVPFFQDFGTTGNTGSPIFFFFSDSMKQSDTLTAAGTLTSFTFTASNNQGTTVGSDNLAGYVSRYQAAYGASVTPDMSTGSPQAYDATYLIALAMAASAQSTGTAVRDHLLAVASGGTAFGPQDTKAALAAAKAGTDIDYQGVSGPVDFDSNGDVGGLYDVYQIAGGAFTTLQSAVSP